VKDWTWPTGGAAIIEIKVTLPTFKCVSERLVWLRHFAKLADRKQPIGVDRSQHEN
jgi:hypothetical protein